MKKYTVRDVDGYVANENGVINTGTTSGNFTPTISNLVDISTATVTNATYAKIGTIVTARISITATSGTTSSFGLDYTLPINRTLESVLLVGVGVANSSANSDQVSFVTNCIDSSTGSLHFDYGLPNAADIEIVLTIQYSILE
jgi:hypothetical protein